MSRETDHYLLFILLELSTTDYCSLMMSPRGLWDPGRMAFSFHRIGSTSFVLGDLGSKLQKIKKLNIKNLTLKKRSPFCLIFLIHWLRWRGLMPPRPLIKCMHILQLIFQRPIDTGTVPDIWKEANVSPIYKEAKNLSHPTTGQSH